MHYVLIDTNESGGGTPIGIFDSPDLDDECLAAYFGEFETAKFIDIRDSGLEWKKTIVGSDGCTSILTMHYFMLNEI